MLYSFRRTETTKPFLRGAPILIPGQDLKWSFLNWKLTGKAFECNPSALECRVCKRIRLPFIRWHGIVLRDSFLLCPSTVCHNAPRKIFITTSLAKDSLVRLIWHDPAFPEFAKMLSFYSKLPTWQHVNARNV